MARAIALADRATVLARPNPGVGCVLLRDDEVVAVGASERAGGRHAEVVALGIAGALARGATAVVTLEPCDHTGRTGPCSLALLEAGVSRVVVACPDPSPTAAGGAGRLRAAGVEVVAGPLGDWAQEVHRAFLTGAREGRPHVTLKHARTRDGALALAGRRWVTGEAARRRVHELRAASDGVLVGVGTVLADNPRLDARDVPVVVGQPRPVIVDTSLRTPLDAHVVRPGAIVLAAEGHDTRSRAALGERGVDVVAVPLGADGRLDLGVAAQALFARGITTLLAEPGPILQAALLAAGLVDDVIVHAAPDVADAPDLPTVPLSLAHPLGLDVRRIRLLGEDLEVHARPVR